MSVAPAPVTEECFVEETRCFASPVAPPQAEEAVELAEAVENLLPIEENVEKADLCTALSAAVGVIAMGIGEAVHEELCNRYCAEFGISEKTFDLVTEFYNDNSDDELIANGLLRKVIVECKSSLVSMYIEFY